jgi:Zn-dependent alcohol dehydrogenase
LAGGAYSGIGSVGVAGRGAAKTATQAGDHIVLGIRAQGLEQTAAQVGARHLLNDPNWRASLQTAIANPSTKFTISIDGFAGSSVYSKLLAAAQRGLTPAAKATEWEIGQLFQAGRQGGKSVPNPLGL